MQELSFDPKAPVPEKLHAEPAPAPATDRVALINAIAERVRADSRDRRAVTPESVVLGLADGLRHESLNQILADMAEDDSFADIMGIVAPAGRIYLFSTAHLATEEARRRGHIEESKRFVLERIRADSRKVILTSVADLTPLFPNEDPALGAVVLAEVEAGSPEIQKVVGPKGETYYHCETYLTAAYAQIMMRANTGDACYAVAELVRDRSRTLPKPTKIDTLQDPVFRIDPARLDEVVAQTLAKYPDVRKLVHPETSGAYLYSSQWLDEEQAFLLMDWAEVGAARNP